jgi:hypothetical protein
MRKSRFLRGVRATIPPGAPPFARQRPARRSNMDIERINAIGKSIADLTERTNALRGYL